MRATVNRKKKPRKVRKAVLERRAAKMRHAEWSLAVRKRDSVNGVFTCILCGAKEYIQAHHWYVSKRCCASLATDTDNGASLCLRCHKVRTHKQGTYKTHSLIRQAMVRILGIARFNALVDRAKNECKDC